jgi:hypothetical protein
VDLIDWLFSHGAWIPEKRTGRSLLAAALNGLNPTSAFPRLVAAGCDPYLQHAEHKAAVDILADGLDIARLRQLDTKGAYKSLLKEFTPPPNSPFIGRWAFSPEGGGFGSIGIVLRPDGTAAVGNDLGVGTAVWKISKGEAVILDANSSKEKNEANLMRFRLAGDELVTGSDDRTMKLKRVGGSGQP